MGGFRNYPTLLGQVAAKLVRRPRYVELVGDWHLIGGADGVQHHAVDHEGVEGEQSVGTRNVVPLGPKDSAARPAST
jgi:hypothetical protein